MVDACYVCRRTQADLDHLNEEIRTRVYLSYFSNIRAQLDERQRQIRFLQRLKDEESSDPHFRIGAAQVFGDPQAYEKLMPWIDTLLEIARGAGKPTDAHGTMGELVEKLLAEGRAAAARLEESLNRVRAGFATGGGSPLSLESVTQALPVAWPADLEGIEWLAGRVGDREPLRRSPGEAPPAVEVPLHLCSACRALLGGR